MLLLSAYIPPDHKQKKRKRRKRVSAFLLRKDVAYTNNVEVIASQQAMIGTLDMWTAIRWKTIKDPLEIGIEL